MAVGEVASNDGGIVCVLCDGNIKLVTEFLLIIHLVREAAQPDKKYFGLDPGMGVARVLFLACMRVTAVILPMLDLHLSTKSICKIFHNFYINFVRLLTAFQSAYPMFLNPPNQFFENLLGIPLSNKIKILK